MKQETTKILDEAVEKKPTSISVNLKDIRQLLLEAKEKSKEKNTRIVKRIVGRLKNKIEIALGDLNKMNELSEEGELERERWANLLIINSRLLEDIESLGQTLSGVESEIDKMYEVVETMTNTDL
eukprot:TRINITY_DN13146_c0_g1_i1.p1 TRINITY_DN13146_c0_g1~~TRINITY_DN13146_c0_g1_i1.p1  ORF type:complete len:125 (-),score=20.11 TRINITY_DN13146_c0_g1_i1:81-455(-)